MQCLLFWLLSLTSMAISNDFANYVTYYKCGISFYRPIDSGSGDLVFDWLSRLEQAADSHSFSLLVCTLGPTHTHRRGLLRGRLAALWAPSELELDRVLWEQPACLLFLAAPLGKSWSVKCHFDRHLSVTSYTPYLCGVDFSKHGYYVTRWLSELMTYLETLALIKSQEALKFKEDAHGHLTCIPGSFSEGWHNRNPVTWHQSLWRTILAVLLLTEC